MVDLTSHHGTNFSVRKLGVFLGAEITEIDLRKNLSKKTQTSIADAHATHGVLVFPKQKITNNDLYLNAAIKTFGNNFDSIGGLDRGYYYIKSAQFILQNNLLNKFDSIDLESTEIIDTKFDNNTNRKSNKEKRIIKPNNEELQLHKKYLKLHLPKNYYN